MAGRRVVIDPVTRVEGHLRLEIEVADGVVTDAWASAGLYRGMEAVLKGRDPADAFFIAQRICGVCPVSQGHAASMAVESALKIAVPNNARLIRNLIEGAQLLQSHLLSFYTLSLLDYVDVTAALTADVGKAYDLARVAGTRVADFGAVQRRLKALSDSGRMSILGGGWAGHPAYELPAELDLIALAHYLEALEVQAEAGAIIALLGGKFPHFMTSVPGGTTWIPTDEKLASLSWRLAKVKAFVDEALVPDLLAMAPYHLGGTTFGQGVGNLLAWGVFDDAGRDPGHRFLPRGTIVESRLEVIEPDVDKVMEFVECSFYTPDSGQLHPQAGVTHPRFAQPDPESRYSWAKAPRLDGRPMEVGPLARMMVAYARGVTEVRMVMDDALTGLGSTGKPEIMLSLLGRVLSRGLEAKVVAARMLGWLSELTDALRAGDSAYITESSAVEGDGAGLWEGPRGALGHWLGVRGGRIARYQVVAPTTWNASPRDADGRRGPLEEALVGTPVADAERPLEALRVVHSFDPCLACAVHVIERRSGRRADVLAAAAGAPSRPPRTS